MTAHRGNKWMHRQRGQALIIFVFALVGLLLAVGLAVDGGTAIVERRRMQAAADAAALAGARELADAGCSRSAQAADAAVYAAMLAYAQRNGVADPNAVQGYYVRFYGSNVVEYTPPVRVGSGAVPERATGIRVTTAMTRSTYFFGLVGVDSASVGATATAVAGPTAVGGGFRPFGLPRPLVEGLNPDDLDNNWFQITFSHNGGTIQWVGSVPDQHRGWMNFGYIWNPNEAPTFPRAVDQNTNAATLAEWMRNGWQGTMYGGDYVHAKPGTDASVVCEAPVDTLFYVPVYDVILDCPTEIDPPKPTCPSQGSSYCYHIVGFAAMKIIPGTCSQGGKTFEGRLVEVIMGNGVVRPNAGWGSEATCGWAKAVTLWR